MAQMVHCDWLLEQARWSHIAYYLLVRSRWLDIGLILFLQVYGPQLHLGP